VDLGKVDSTAGSTVDLGKVDSTAGSTVDLDKVDSTAGSTVDLDKVVGGQELLNTVGSKITGMQANRLQDMTKCFKAKA
jgi:hypothetical protein